MSTVPTVLAPQALPDGSPAALAAALPAGNVLVLGGPGSGKTSLLEAAVLALLSAPGGRALFLTSSRPAAVASTERILHALPGPAAGGAIGCVAWHRFARGLVSSHADLLAYRGEPRPLSPPEQWSLVRSLLLLDPPVVDWGALEPLARTRAFADELAGFLLACQRHRLGPDDLAALASRHDRPAWAAAARLLDRYLSQLGLDDSVDVAGLMVQAGDLLERHPAVLASTVGQVGTVLVDEAQELDPTQWRLLELLAGGGARVVLAGDPAAVTDAYRGALPGRLRQRAAALGATTVVLARGRRLGGPALDGVRRLQTAAGEEPPPLRAAGTTTVEVARHAGPAEEADGIARLLERAHRHDRVPYGRMAVLLPSTRRLAGPVRRALERHGVPYRLGYGEQQLVAEPAVRHVLDLFRVALDPGRADELLPSLLTSPLGGLDRHELRALRRAAVLADRSLAEQVRAVTTDDPAGSRVTALVDLIEAAGGWARTLPADQCFWELWQRAPAFAALVRQVRADHADAAASRQLDALTAFSKSLAGFVDRRPGASMRTYLEVVERAEFAGDTWLPPAGAPGSAGGDDAVALLSVLGAKGQEFDVVVMGGCLEGVLPRTTWPSGLFEAWRLDGDATPTELVTAELAAERRRFALAASRARRRLVCTWSKVDGRGEPSRFLAELGAVPPPEPREGEAPAPEPAGSLEVAGRLRRQLADRSRPAAERLAAATTLATVARTDPATWWWRHDWTSDPEPIASEGRLRTSYSRIGTYEDCHLRYFFGSVAGLDDRTSYQMAFGKLMHTVFELAAKGEVAGDPAALKAAFRERFDPAWFPSRAVAHQYWRDGMAMLELWHRGEAATARDALAFEVSFEMDVAGHTVRGRIDRVDRAEAGIVLLDYKTARTPATSEQAAASLQLAIYYLAALRDPELATLGEPVEMQLVYPARERQGRFARVSQHPGPDHAERVEQRLVPLLDGAAAEAFDPNPHADCRFCAFKTICPMWAEGEELLASTPGLSEVAP